MRFSLFILLGLLGGSSVFADWDQAPPSFEAEVEGGRVVFADFQSAAYEITFNLANKSAWSRTTIEFFMEEEGSPVVDLLAEAKSVFVDQRESKLIPIRTPDKVTTFRVLNSKLKKGLHRVVIVAPLKKGVKFSGGTVQAAFWYSDLEDRQYLEQYLPTNLEYDQYAMSFTIQFEGGDQRHDIFTNGKLIQINSMKYRIDFPEYFNSSGPFFHIARKDRYAQKTWKFESISKKVIPVTVYAQTDYSLEEVAKKALTTLKELEKDFGPYLHPSLLIYFDKEFPGGMEYQGATVSNLMSLSHEITHSWFGRGVMSSTGNSGWIDEAIASWRDSKYEPSTTPPTVAYPLGGSSPYRRSTTVNAYSEGKVLLAYIEYIFRVKFPEIKLKDCLCHLVDLYQYETLDSQQFQRLIQDYSTADFEELFTKYVYKGASDEGGGESPGRRNPRSSVHQRLDLKTLQKFI